LSFLQLPREGECSSGLLFDTASYMSTFLDRQQFWIRVNFLSFLSASRALLRCSVTLIHAASRFLYWAHWHLFIAWLYQHYVDFRGSGDCCEDLPAVLLLGDHHPQVATVFHSGYLPTETDKASNIVHSSSVWLMPRRVTSSRVRRCCREASCKNGRLNCSSSRSTTT